MYGMTLELRSTRWAMLCLLVLVALSLPSDASAKGEITQIRVCGASTCSVVVDKAMVRAFMSAITNAELGRAAPPPSAYFTLRPEWTAERPGTWPRYTYVPAARMIRLQRDRRDTPEWRWLGRRDALVRAITGGLDPFPKLLRWKGLVRLEISGPAIARRYPPGPSVMFSYPADWYVTFRRLDNVTDPRTIFAVASYPIPRGRLDDCPGTRARGRPDNGVFLLVTEVLDGASLRRSLPRLPARPSHFRLPTDGRAGCLPAASRVFQFRVGGRAFYVWVSVGPTASPKTRAALAALLNGMRIEPLRKR